MAGKFKYRLQKVLDLRYKREDNLKLELAAVTRARDAEREVLEELTARQTGAQKNMNSQLAAGRTSDVQMSNDYLGALEGKIKAQQKKLETAESKVKETEAEYQKAQREREVVKKHKEKSHERWLTEEKRVEGIRLDEMSSIMYNAKQRRLADEVAEESEREERMAQAEESSWIQGFLDTAHQEAERLTRERR